MKLLTLLLIVMSPFAMAKSSYHKEIEDFRLYESAAIETIEDFVWGYSVASLKNGCESIGGKVIMNEINTEMIADKAWVHIKYNSDPKESLIQATIDYITSNYPCTKRKEEAN